MLNLPVIQARSVPRGTATISDPVASLVDFLDLGQQQFFVLVDYWSGFFEVQEVKVATSASAITVCKVQFARHGIPDVLITDNGIQCIRERVAV